jgi:hypothetical protein
LTGALAVVIVIGVLIALWVGLGLISRTIDETVNFLGWAIGSAFKPSSPQTGVAPQGELILTRPGDEVRGALASTGAIDPTSGYLTTSSGVLVEIAVASSPATLACRWNPAVTDKPTQIMGDVLRAVRQVDAGAHVVL